MTDMQLLCIALRKVSIYVLMFTENVFSSFRHAEGRPGPGRRWQQQQQQQRGHHHPLPDSGAASGGPAGSGERQRRVSQGGDAQRRRGEGDPGSLAGALPAEPRVRGDAAEPQRQHTGPEGELRLCCCVWQVHQVMKREEAKLSSLYEWTSQSAVWLRYRAL